MSYLSQFHYQITGAEPSPKLVFLHGVMGFGANWRRVAKEFEADYQVLTYDQRGHGRSFQPPNGYAPQDYAEDLHKILQELGWQEITLVGHSMGGRNALEFASLFPQQVTRLVIEDIGPSMNHAGAGFILGLLDVIPVPFASKREAKAFFDKDFMQLYAHHPQRAGLAMFLYANIIENESGQGVWRFSVAGIRASIAHGRKQEKWAQIEALRMPTLLIRGELSNDLPRDIFAEVLRRNPRIQGVEIAGAGHWVHSDKPEEFIRALQDFFAQ